jgi:hypothetical protein
MRKILFATLLALSAAFNLSAQPTPGPIHIGPNPQLWATYPPCDWTPSGNVMNVAEAFALGNIFADGSTVDEGNDYLEDNSPVYPALCIVNTFYQTTVDHHVTAVILQQGSSIDVAEEWVFWVRFTLPSGKQIRFKQQFDKHAANGNGNQHVVYPVSLFLPAGTWVQITRPAVACVGIPARTVVNPAYPGAGGTANDYGPYNQNNCITGQSVTLVGSNP